MMESWRKVWRDGLAPVLSDDALKALRQGLVQDDPRLVQGATTVPPPLQRMLDWPCEGSCVVGYCGWKGEALETVAEVEEFFGRVCCEADERLGQPAAVRYFLNWFDDSPRADVRRQLLAEVQRSLGERLFAAEGVEAGCEAEVAAA